jgi:hypothetical protein
VIALTMSLAIAALGSDVVDSVLPRLDPRGAWAVWVATDEASRAGEDLTSYHLLRAFTLTPAYLRANSRLLEGEMPDDYEGDYPEVRRFLASHGLTDSLVRVEKAARPNGTREATRDLQCVLAAGRVLAEEHKHESIEPRDLIAGMARCPQSLAAVVLQRYEISPAVLNDLYRDESKK